MAGAATGTDGCEPVCRNACAGCRCCRRVAHLAYLLMVPQRKLERWISGVEQAPLDAFLCALDLIADGHLTTPPRVSVLPAASMEADSHPTTGRTSATKTCGDSYPPHRAQAISRNTQAGLQPAAMDSSRNRALSRLARWARLPAGSADALDQLRQQLQMMSIPEGDRHGVRLAARVLALADELHNRIGDEPEYVKRARLNHALARLCQHVEAQSVEQLTQTALESLPGTASTKTSQSSS